MVTRILFIRHAAIDNGGRLYGSFDLPLSAAGRGQVDALVHRRPMRPAPDALFTSPLCRARDVALALGRVWRLPPQNADWAREIHCGHVEGLPLDQLQSRFAAHWARNEAQADETFAWPGGETYAEFRARVVQGLAAAASSHAGRRVAVVTHAGVISQVLGIVRRRPASVWSADRPDPLTATEVTWEHGAPREILSFNDPDWY